MNADQLDGCAEAPTEPVYHDVDTAPDANELADRLAQARASLAILGGKNASGTTRKQRIRAGFAPFIIERKMDSQGSMPDEANPWSAVPLETDNDTQSEMAA